MNLDVAADKLKLIQYTGYPGDLCECAGNSATYAETVRGGNDDMTYRVDDCNEWSAGYCERVVIVDSRCFCTSSAQGVSRDKRNPAVADPCFARADEHTEDQCGEK